MIKEKIIITIVKFEQFPYKRILFYLLNEKESKSKAKINDEERAELLIISF